MQAVCVFCGSSPGRDPAFGTAARRLGTTIAAGGRTLVYGGSNVGLMAALADAAIAAGGRTIGVIPEALAARGLAHPGLTELHVVGTMHERKALMVRLADGFIALPGGIGTLDELFETLAWAQLGIHAKPCGLLDVDGFFEPLLHLLDQLVAQRFVRPEHRRLLLHEVDPARLLDLMAGSSPVDLPKWLDGPPLA